MNPLMQVPGQTPGKYRVGQMVRIKHGHRGVIGEVIEDRGPIGFRGAPPVRRSHAPGSVE